MMTRLLQLLLVAATLAGLVIFGFIRDSANTRLRPSPTMMRRNRFHFQRMIPPIMSNVGAAMSRL